MPVVMQNNLIGTVGIVTLLDALFGHAIYFRPNKFSYAFIIDHLEG